MLGTAHRPSRKDVECLADHTRRASWGEGLRGRGDMPRAERRVAAHGVVGQEEVNEKGLGITGSAKWGIRMI